MGFDYNTFPSATPQQPSDDSQKQLNKDRQAAARKIKRAEHEARTTVRKCLGCETEFRSEGNHNRLCRRCQSRR